MQHRGFNPTQQYSSLNIINCPNLGDRHVDPLTGKVWMFARANGNLVAGDVHQLAEDGSFDMTPMTTTTLNSIARQLGVPEIAVTDNYYAWFFVGCIAGSCNHEIVVSNGVSANSVLTSTATAGEIGSGGTPIDGVRNIDAGVTDTRVTCIVFGMLTAGVTAAYD